MFPMTTLDQIVYIHLYFLVFKTRVLVRLLLDLKPHGGSQGSSQSAKTHSAHGTDRQTVVRLLKK